MTTETDSRQDSETQPPQKLHEQYDVDHSVTRRNTVKHWTLYTLDAIEAEMQVDDESADNFGENPQRSEGTLPEHIYEYAAGDDSIVFRNEQEISSALSEMGRMAPFYHNEDRPVNRRTDTTEWEGMDVQYRYRLTEFGREVLLDLGRPDKLPNRHRENYERALSGVLPAHMPGWWLDEYDLYSSEWDIRNHDWMETDHERVWFNDVGSGIFANRGYDKIGYKLAETFEDVTFVLTVGPYRSHDLMYAIRDPWKRVVQIDIYSPMYNCRSKDEIQQTFEALCKDLAKGLKSVNEGQYKPPADDNA